MFLIGLPSWSSIDAKQKVLMLEEQTEHVEGRHVSSEREATLGWILFMTGDSDIKSLIHLSKAGDAD